MDMHKSGFNNAVARIVIYQRYNDGERNLIRKSQVFPLTTSSPPSLRISVTFRESGRIITHRNTFL